MTPLHAIAPLIISIGATYILAPPIARLWIKHRDAIRRHTKHLAGLLTPLWVADRRNRRRLTALIAESRESAAWHRLRAAESERLEVLRAECAADGHPLAIDINDGVGCLVASYCRCARRRVEKHMSASGVVTTDVVIP